MAKNEREVVRVGLQTFNGRAILNLRISFTPEGSDDLRPGKAGLAIAVSPPPALAAAINAALAVATERGDFAEEAANG